MHAKIDVYQIVSDRIMTLLDKGVNPWRKPWAAAAWKAPRNLVSNKEYRGVNVLLLGLSDYEAPYWVSFKQALDLGGNVRKGEKSSLAVFWKWYERGTIENEDGTLTQDRIPVLRYYNVFNVAQCEGLEFPAPEAVPTYNHDPIKTAESIVDAMPNRPHIVNNNPARAFYRRDSDTVNMPPYSRFEKAAEYYSTLFHELTHATGHESRIGRKLGNEFGSVDYGREELIAEMGAAYLCGLAGILDETADNTAAYIDGWRAIIRQDRRAVVLAASAAQKAVDYITNKHQAQHEEAAA